MRYDRHEDMVAPARAKPQFWRLVLGVICSFAILWSATVFLVATIFTALGEIDGELFLKEIENGSTARGALVLIVSVSFLALGPLVLARALHGRHPLTLLGPTGRITFDFFLSLRAVAILYAILLLLPGDTSPEKAMTLGAWLALLPLSLFAILAQVSAEEIAFRGYLQSELAARFRSPAIWMVGPALLFAFIHYAPDQNGSDALPYAGLVFVFALMAADLTARTGTLGAAIALHFANNVFAITIVSFEGSLSALALYHYPLGADGSLALTPRFWVDLGIMIVSWLAIRVSLRV